ncbi:MAG: hypothetical protein KDA42_13440 [Planctomycetales bacterium]|nr:hypothetical protein [Planctomycetales bacterium]
MSRRRLVAHFLLAVLAVSNLPSNARAQRKGPPRTAFSHSDDWRTLLERRVPAYGHRNWIVIADSAYPAQTSPGIETIVTGADHLEVLQAVLAGLEGMPHVRPIKYVDAELPHVPEKDAPGVTKYREALRKALGGKGAIGLPHEDIIAKLDAAGQQFKVLILKTNMTLPYTSVFLELDCGYWSAEAETRLREAMAEVKPE